MKQKTNNLSKKCAKDLHRHFSRKDLRMVYRYMKRCLTSLIIKEMQIKIIMRYYLLPIKMAYLSRITEVVTVAMKLKDTCSLEGKL